MLSSSETIVWNQISEGLRIQLPNTLTDALAVSFKIDI
jgi:hypothetical protein